MPQSTTEAVIFPTTTRPQCIAAIARGLPSVISLMQTATRNQTNTLHSQRETWHLTNYALQKWAWYHLINVYNMSEVSAAQLIATFVEAS